MKEMKWVILLALNIFLIQVDGQSQNENVEYAPNVIFILADDMCIGDIQRFNNGISRTPNIDRLIDNGVWFDQAYSASAVCAPARAALLTGKYPQTTGVVSLNMQEYPQFTHLNTRFYTIADVFKENNYRTGLIGKWHLGFGVGYHPMDRGFDEFKGFLGFDIDTYFKYNLDINRNYISYDGPYLTDVLTDFAIDFVNEHSQEKFFLNLAYYTPHRPLGAPQDLIDFYLAKGLEEKTATIYAMIEAMDSGIGRIIDQLEENGIMDNTIVIFASDNGPDPLTGQRYNAGLRGEKYSVNEGGIRVPLIFNWNGQWPQDKISEPVHFVDLLPTLIDLCDLKITKLSPMDGLSFASLLNHSSFYNAAKYRCWQWNRGVPMYSHNAALREGNWKLVRPFITRGLPLKPSSKPARLYNLSKDPSESTDVSTENPKIYHRLNVLLEDWCRIVEYKRLALN